MLHKVISLLLSITLCAFGADPLPTDEQVISWLKELKPLPKVHYSWPIKLDKMPDKMPDELLDEYARLTHAVSLSGEWGTVEQIEPAVLACRKVNADQPKVAASIGMN